jgi:hypothetical protein
MIKRNVDGLVVAPRTGDMVLPHTHTLPPTHPHKTQGHGSVKASYDERFTCGEPVQELHQSGMERQRVSEKQAD